MSRNGFTVRTVVIVPAVIAIVFLGWLAVAIGTTSGVPAVVGYFLGLALLIAGISLTGRWSLHHFATFPKSIDRIGAERRTENTLTDAFRVHDKP